MRRIVQVVPSETVVLDAIQKKTFALFYLLFIF